MCVYLRFIYYGLNEVVSAHQPAAFNFRTISGSFVYVLADTFI